MLAIMIHIWELSLIDIKDTTRRYFTDMSADGDTLQTGAYVC